jgi:hypothetical protein
MPDSAAPGRARRYGNTEASANAYEALWTNADGIADAWAAAWGRIAKRFAGRPEVGLALCFGFPNIYLSGFPT